MTDHTYELKVIEDEFSRYRQAAGLSPLPGRNFDSPDHYRGVQIRTLQAALPKSVPASVRGNLSPQAPADEITKTEQRVKEAVLKMAAESDTLRAVVMHDKTGREITEFHGPKRQWMARYTGPALEMKRIGDAKF